MVATGWRVSGRFAPRYSLRGPWDYFGDGNSSRKRTNEEGKSLRQFPNDPISPYLSMCFHRCRYGTIEFTNILHIRQDEEPRQPCLMR
jgi:hypothetical protein